MRGWPIRAFACGCALLGLAFPVQWTQGQTGPPTFDSRAVENATTIADGVCRNPVIGISYQLTEGLSPEDAAKMREFAYKGSSARGIGPEARYFLFGYEETEKSVMLCGGANDAGSVQVIASPLSALGSSGPPPLEQLAGGLGEELHAQPSPPHVKTVSGLKLVCADVQKEISASQRGKIETRGTTCAAVVGSFVVMWNLIGYTQQAWERLVASMDSVKVFAPEPLGQPPPGPSPRPPKGVVAVDFQAQLAAFMKAWLMERNSAKTKEFFDPAAYSAPPLIGAYCDGWYRRGTPPNQVAQTMSQDLMGVPADFPQKSEAAAIFAAWNRLPPQWAGESANDVAHDHFLVVRLDPDTLGRMFSGVFARSDCRQFLESQIQKNGSAYWVVFPEVAPNQDLFVVFTLWQKAGAEWKITDMDVICQ
jgi:hypothetical protein